MTAVERAAWRDAHDAGQDMVIRASSVSLGLDCLQSTVWIWRLMFFKVVPNTLSFQASVSKLLTAQRDFMLVYSVLGLDEAAGV